MEQRSEKTREVQGVDEHGFFINRHLSWLAFNERVMEEGEDSRNPLFERLKYLSITSSNMDEFFMVKVANVKDQLLLGFSKPDSKSLMTPKEQLIAIEQYARTLVKRQYDYFYEAILPALREEKISFLRAQEMNEEQSQFANTFFHDRVFPVLTPMGVDPSHPFPLLHNKTLNLAVQLQDTERNQTKELFAFVQVPSVLPRFIQLPSQDDKKAFILLEDLIRSHIAPLFAGKTVLSVDAFRITRNADIFVNEEDAEDLLEEIEEELKKRQMGVAVRLEIESSMSESVKEFIKESEELEESDIYPVEGPVDLTFLMQFSHLEGYDHLRFEKLYSQPPEDILGEANLYDVISRKDILLHHPYESFDPVVQFIQKASVDPNVLAIKMTLYRVSRNSPIVQALEDAAANGKQVLVLVELKARFDEESNIAWAKRLEKAGCHVIYGMVGLKTHSKITLVVRQEGERIKRYVHLGTGNYNEITANLYTDLGMFTSREEVGEDATLFFNHLSGQSRPPQLKTFSIAPSGLRSRFLALIQETMDQSTPEAPGHIIAKMNALTDKEIIDALYAASQAGVKIELIIRGICCLRPGVPGLSQNIRVISIVGRFLEHSRVYYFQKRGIEEVYLSSADWMTRNLDRRVEILFPVLDDGLRKRVKEILATSLKDSVKARELQPDGTYRHLSDGAEWSLDSQLFFHQMAVQNAQGRK
ncbi:RNA degradosome polyphosphate kinase [Ammoniphilus sp. YIM 78166]|uniref:RNA degradosome polyphosphate kinase n=1 Tax=Ammoniphilus sp. YIM 78166 TaxID=1644106 RepID=UPI00106FC732|nr:RNA degradosome polyphosphate kinase [Ammoniphilus sp. YIM 78166]